MPSYATKEKLDHAAGVNISDLASKKILLLWKLKLTKFNDLDVAWLKNVPVHLKKLSDVVDNKVFKNAGFNTLKTKIDNLEKKIPDATTLTHINQYNTDKQNLEKEIENVDKKIPDVSGLVTTTVLDTKFSELENKIPDHANYITTQEFNKLTAEHFAVRLKRANLVSKTYFDNKL